jgi:putative ABC transport system permease protein
MRWLSEFKYLIRKLNRRRSEREIEEEIQAHLDLETQERLEAGCSPEEAHYAARRAFGGVAQAKEFSRAIWGFRILEILWQDLRYGLRVMAKRPGFSLTAVGMLAVGIATSTSVFSLADALILRPFNFPNQDRLVMIWSQNTKQGWEHKYIPPAVFTNWQEKNQGFEQLVRYRFGTVDLRGADHPEQVLSYIVSANFFDALGVKAALGRTFQPGEDEPGRHQVAVLRHSFWRNRFGADPHIIGRSIRAGDESYTVIGVAPENFNFPPADGQFWRPLAFDEKTKHDYLAIAHSAFGLLKPGVSPQVGAAELDSGWRLAAEIHPEWHAGITTQVIEMTDDFVRNKKMYLPILVGAVAFLLLIVCANTANMMLGRALGRRKEIAVRLALGATRKRLIGQMLTESLLLAFAGGVLGLLLSIWAIGFFKEVIPDDLSQSLPGFESLGVNRAALLFTLLISTLTGMLFGLAPAWQSSKPKLNETLKEGTKGATGPESRSRLRSLLVIAEVALSLVLLSGAGLMIRSFTAMLRDDSGFKSENLLSFGILLSGASETAEKSHNFYSQLSERLKTLPGVTGVGGSDALPMGGNQNTLANIVGRPASDKNQKILVDFRYVTPGYFDLIGMSLRSGRDFNAGDHEHAPKVAIINESFARRFFPGQEPLRQRLEAHGEIVGIVSDARDDNLDKAAKPGVYVPFTQGPVNFMGIVLRSSLDPAALTAMVRSEVAKLNPHQPIQNFKTMERRIYERTLEKRMMTVMMGVFAGIALLLAAIGLYAVMALAVSQRTHEIGVRLALGAQRRNIMQLILGQGLKLTLIGLTIGMAGALALTKVMTPLLYGVRPTDPLTFLLVSLTLAGAALLACLLPARRATRVDPMIALRCD